MDELPVKAENQNALLIMMTEHSNLQAMRSATIAEATGRTTLFLGAVSSSLIALAFVGQVSKMGAAFSLFALILLPSLIFLGLATFIRTYQSGTEDMIAARGINRIRHYYTEVAPQLKKYLILSRHDDLQGMLQNMGVTTRDWWQLFVSTHGLVGIINSVLTAVFFGLLVTTLLNASLSVAGLTATAVFFASGFLHFRYQSLTFDAVNEKLEILFPSKTE